jgi:hypothetical protein
MIKRILFLIALILCAVAADAQGIPQTITVLGPTGGLKAGAKVTVCAFPATGGVPCTNTLSLFSDILLSVPLLNPMTTDSFGTVTFFTSSPANGTITYTITGAGTASPQGPYNLAAFTGTVNNITACFTTGGVPFQNGTNNTITCNGNITWTTATNTLVLSNAAGINSQTISNPTLATAIANQPSPTFCLAGNFWTGATSSTDSYCLNVNIPAGNNPATSLNFIHAGSPQPSTYSFDGSIIAGTINASGLTVNTGGVNFTNIGPANFAGSIDGSAKIESIPHQGTPNPISLPTSTGVAGQFWQYGSGTNPALTAWATTGVQCGTIAANGACANTLTTAEHCISGIATLNAGTSTITGISPAFTSSSSFFVVTNDITTIANPSKGVPASGSTITFTGTTTDNIQFIACGG